MLLPDHEATANSTPPPGEAEVSLEHFFELSLDLLTLAGFDGYFKRVNPTWCTTLGWTREELFAVPSVEFVHPEDRAATLAARHGLKDGAPLTGLTNRYRCKDGSYRWLEWRSIADPARQVVYAVARDVTVQRAVEQEQRRVQAQLRSSERMASVGRLAAGVAHEINNPLAFIMANLRSALEELPGLQAGGPEARADLGEMLTDSLVGAERVRKIVRGLGTIARVGTGQRLPVRLQPLIEQAISLLGHELRYRARLHLELGDTPLLEADPTRVEQLFTHLLLNAAQSFPGEDPERNTIRVSSSTDAGGGAVIEFEDNGAGMSPSTLERLFEPFFTTREGGGTGLGLAICHEIVVDLGGSITVKSEQGKGSLFRVELPGAPTR
ncbi:MAG: ATP-binding protein [Myxococcota bacterium]|nr:ATP-binding protein [Myxococcota bacterium]